MFASTLFSWKYCPDGGYSNKKPEYLVYQEEGMDEAFRVVSDVAGER